MNAMVPFTAWRKEEYYLKWIRFQRQCILVLCVFCLLLCVGWMRSPSQLRIFIPPDISQGANFKSDAISDAFIYSFAYQVWQELNTWTQDGTQNYPQNLHTYSGYLTPEFQEQLQQDYQTLLSAGQVQRQRLLQGLAGATFESTSVKKLSDTTWEVDLKMRLVEYKNHQCVKDVEIVYPLLVTRYSVAESVNPYGLTLAGFESQPIRLNLTTEAGLSRVGTP